MAVNTGASDLYATLRTLGLTGMSYGLTKVAVHSQGFQKLVAVTSLVALSLFPTLSFLTGNPASCLSLAAPLLVGGMVAAAPQIFSSPWKVAGAGGAALCAPLILLAVGIMVVAAVIIVSSLAVR